MSNLVKLEYSETEQIEIVRSVLPDIKDIASLHQNVFPGSDKLTPDVLTNKGITKFVLYKNSEAVGMFFLHPLTNNVLYLTTFGVKDNHRRQNIGTELFAKAVWCARRYGVKRILFDSEKGSGLEAFFKKVGGRIIEKGRVDIWAVDV